MISRAGLPGEPDPAPEAGRTAADDLVIVVSGTHASGKSTLISDFTLHRPNFTVLPDPYELIDEESDVPHAAMFAAQLRLSADRLIMDRPAGDVIAERGPIDFLAYLLALEELAGAAVSGELLERSAAITAAALEHVDVLVVLPLSDRDEIRPGFDEDPELRAAMNEVLLELIDDPDLTGGRLDVVEIVGGRRERLAVLEALVDGAVR